jgi:hypothetical protein
MRNQMHSDAWRADLRFLAEELPRRHANLFHTMTRDQFEAAVAALDARIPSLAQHQVVAELMRLVALIGDGHSYVDLGEPGEAKAGFRIYPLRLYLFSDGLFVRQAARSLAEAAGARVLAIGDTPVARAYERVSEVVSRDNASWVRYVAPKLMAVPEVLHGLGVIADMERATITVERDGERSTIELRPLASEAGVEWVDAAAAADAPVPLWLRDQQNNFWFEYLDDYEALYVQYNAVRDKPDETLAAFFGRVFDFADTHAVGRFVLDLRHNHGGNGYLNQPIVHGLIRHEQINQPGRLFTIVGRETFSAAMMLTVDLEKHTRTLFVGEPTGASPNMYGDNVPIALPNSGLVVKASALHWVYSEPRDARPWLAPDIPAALSSADYRARRDPALEAILPRTPQPGDAEAVAFPDRLFREIDPFLGEGDAARLARYVPEPPFTRVSADSAD